MILDRSHTQFGRKIVNARSCRSVANTRPVFAMRQNDTQTNQVILGLVILVVLMILGLLLTGRSGGG